LSFPSSPTIYLSRVCLLPTLWLSAHHLCVSGFSPSNTPPPPIFSPHLSFHTCQARTRSPHTMSNSKLALTISPTFTDHPRTNLVRSTGQRAAFVEWDTFGFLFSVCDDALWAVLNTPPGAMLRVRPDFPAPAALFAVGANPAARDVFKRATESRAAWLACSASFCLAILDSMASPIVLPSRIPSQTPCLYLSPRDIIIAMTVLHGTMTGAEVDGLHQTLKKKFSAVSDLPSHIVAFRGVLCQEANFQHYCQ
jgi:hypothetical protein